MSSGLGFSDLGFAKVDIDRQKRRGFAEAIYCAGKSKEQIRDIAKQLLKKRQDLLLTRLDKVTFNYLRKYITHLKYNSLASFSVSNFAARYQPQILCFSERYWPFS